MQAPPAARSARHCRTRRTGRPLPNRVRMRRLAGQSCGATRLDHNADQLSERLVPQRIDAEPCARLRQVPVAPRGCRAGPIPYSSGAFDKSKVTLQQLGVSSSELQAAQAACQRMLPDGGERPNQAGLRKLERDALNFARCMRSHGVPNWPDYTLRDGTPLFDLHGTTIAPNSPLIVAKQLRCRSWLRLPDSPATSGGARSGSRSD